MYTEELIETLEGELRIRSVQLPERGKEMYFKSTATGQVYKADFVPQFGGYELATEAEYIAWCKAHEISPK